ncbi:TetR family transcriptional regulator [Amycolatopsis sp. NPDC004169]|uniref:TetR/AcrR family transcriptional regulator n=1 Tax=Amycolatopsis sp. NPDC004169 TaxID=3154453 RepID=UPI0033A87099
MPPEIADGRLRKGAARRETLLAATLRVVGRSGVAAVSQRTVAAEAGVPPSAVLYYFASVDDLLVTALREVNERYCAELAAIGDIDGLTAHVVRYAEQDRFLLIAEYELWLLAARRDDLCDELTGWDSVVQDLAVRLAARRPDSLAAALNGLYLRAALTGVDAATVREVLENAL